MKSDIILFKKIFLRRTKEKEIKLHFTKELADLVSTLSYATNESDPINYKALQNAMLIYKILIRKEGMVQTDMIQ